MLFSEIKISDEEFINLIVGTEYDKKNKIVRILRVVGEIDGLLELESDKQHIKLQVKYERDPNKKIEYEQKLKLIEGKIRHLKKSGIQKPAPFALVTYLRPVNNIHEIDIP